MSTIAQRAIETCGTAEISTSEDGLQVVRFPAGIHIEGKTVAVRKVDGGILLEPNPVRRPQTVEEVRAMFARIDGYGGDALFPDGRNQGVLEPENFFD